MKTYKEFLAIINFLGEDMTEEQAIQLMDEAKEALSLYEINALYSKCFNAMYSELSQFNAEMGGLNRY